MRPIELKMSAFGPFAELVTLNLDTLGKNGLYLITGDTGAGKTTIFDGIIYALFGEASGNIRTTDMLRSKYANAAQATYVELTFLFKNKKYTVRRNPEYLRPSKRGEGKFTKEQAKAQLTMPDGDVITGLVSVNNKIIEIIGLNRNQFSQIALIPQGEFLRLLLADTKQRIEIFREIFDTGAYLLMQDKMKKDANDMYRLVSDYKKSMAQYISDVYCDENSEYATALHNMKEDASMTVKENLQIIEHLINEDSSLADEYEKNILMIDKDIDMLNSTLTIVRQTERIKKDYLAATNKLSEVKAEYKNISRLYKNECNKEAERKNLTLNIEKSREKLDSYKLLEKYQNSYKDKQKRINTIAREIQNDDAALNECVKECDTCKSMIDTLKGAELEIEKIRSKIAEITKKKEAVEYLNEVFERKEKAISQADSAKVEYIEAYKLYEKANNEYMQMEKAFFSEQAGIIASALEEGEPCPVCGSVNHPRLAVMGKDAPTEAQLKKFKKNVENKSKECSELSSQSGLLSGQAESIKNIFVETASNFNTQWNENLNIENCSEEEIRESIKSLIINVSDILNKVTLEEKNTDKKVIKYRQLVEQLPKYQQQIEAYKENINTNNNNIAILNTQNEGIKKQIEQLNEELECEDINAARKLISDMMTEKEAMDAAYDKAKKEYEEYTINIATLTNRVDDLNKQLTKESNNEDIDISECELKLEEQKKERLDLRNKKNIVDVRLANNKKILEAVENVNKKVEHSEKRYSWLRALSDTVNGNLSGKSRIKLETYVQMAFFDRIIMRANTRFMMLTDGQYELKRSSGQDNYKNQTGLELDIIDHYNGTIRSVKSLSGGEAFEASLSMALGMSDEIQSQAGGIQIDTMFIDEGFGSLDDDSLSQAVKVLNNLSSSDRLIGIISHVSVLKDRIDKQIVVTKNKTGGSQAVISCD